MMKPTPPLLYCLALAATLLSGCRPRLERTPSVPVVSAPSGELTYVQMDVGQGDSAVLLSPDGRAMLVDGGPPGVEKEIFKTLSDLGIGKLDYVVESHPHADHIGSLPEIVESLPSETFLASGYNHGSQIQKKLLIAMRDHATGKGRRVRKGDRFQLGDHVTVEVLQPQTPFLKNTESDPNNNSVVLRVTYGDTHFLLTGDMEDEERERLLQSGSELRSDVLKISHHGSHNGTDPAFLERVRPQIALISCEAGNDYGHPHEETIRELQEAGARIYRTDLQGNLTLKSDGRSVTVTTERAPLLPVTLSGRETERRGKRRALETSPNISGNGDAKGKSREPRPGLRDTNDSKRETQGRIIGNRRSKVYHLPGGGAQLPAPENRVYFNTETEARKEGFRPAKP